MSVISVKLGRILCLCLLFLPMSAEAAPMRMAVLDFTDAAPGASLDHLGKGLQSMITTDLAAASAFELVERARLKDILGELKLQRRSEIDPTTAVKIGKLAGASHLVSGSFTVYSEKMRIDCRLFAVDSGRVVLAEQVEGEKEAFFELEKALVQKVVVSLGARIAPKERAEMGKVHTADFEAFRKFSEGIVKFDEQKYDAALASMRDATRRDAGFKLAQVTLAGYEVLVSKARASADAARQTEKELALLKADKDAKLGAAIVDRLLRITRQGSKIEKQIATLLIAQIYDRQDISEVPAPFEALRNLSDRFADQRISDNFYKAYLATVAEVFPAASPTPGYIRPPETLDKFDAELARAVAAAKKDASALATSTSIEEDVWNLGDKLHLDRRQRAALLEQAYQLALKLSPSIEWKQERRLELADWLQGGLDLDRSTAYLVQVQQSARDSKTLKRVAWMLERNRLITQLLQESQRKEELREYLRCDGWATVEAVKRGLVGDALTEALGGRCRDWQSEDTLSGAEPTWAFNFAGLSSGPEVDSRLASEVRYFFADKEQLAWGMMGGLLVTGAAPTDRFTIKLTVPFEPARDWQLANRHSFEQYARLTPEEQRPAVSVLFGLRNIQHRTLPLAGYAVRLTRAAVQLVKLTRPASARERELRDQLIAEWPANLGAAKQLAVSVALDGKQLTIEVDGKRWSTSAPADAEGFLGFHFHGTGYAAIGGVQVQRP
ncbi:MAG TPA: CsgG/HfaB family protein [Kofleriaceae bacterium]|nr:CsgG/HfaB family protein [Kofleriaceae bacterium]